MKKSFKLDKNIINYLASLANLKLKDKEIPSLLDNLEETRKFIENINEINTSDIVPTAQTGKLKNISFQDGEKNNRKLSNTEVFKNSKNHKDGFFITKKIL
ncbi:MAG: Asp-tRNA(Asn)/Glu-tRNA(Gln) amidotransferase subunit GatC [bacterium]